MGIKRSCKCGRFVWLDSRFSLSVQAGPFHLGKRPPRGHSPFPARDNIITAKLRREQARYEKQN